MSLSWYKSLNGSASVSNSYRWDWQPTTTSITVTTTPIQLLPAVLTARMISFSVQNIDADPDATLNLYLGDYVANDPASLLSYIGHNVTNWELSSKLTAFTTAGSMKVVLKFALRIDL